MLCPTRELAAQVAEEGVDRQWRQLDPVPNSIATAASSSGRADLVTAWERAGSGARAARVLSTSDARVKNLWHLRWLQGGYVSRSCKAQVDVHVHVEVAGASAGAAAGRV